MPKRDSNLPIIGGIIAAIGAGLCCVGPLALLLLGISSSWIINLTQLEPYRPIFLLAVFGLFGFAGWKVYRPLRVCEPDTSCAMPQTRKRRQITFWIAALIALVLATGNYWIIWLA